MEDYLSENASRESFMFFLNLLLLLELTPKPPQF